MQIRLHYSAVETVTVDTETGEILAHVVSVGGDLSYVEDLDGRPVSGDQREKAVALLTEGTALWPPVTID